jgi:hypothetical protein
MSGQDLPHKQCQELNNLLNKRLISSYEDGHNLIESLESLRTSKSIFLTITNDGQNNGFSSYRMKYCIDCGGLLTPAIDSN